MSIFWDAQVHHVLRDQNNEVDHLAAAIKLGEVMVGVVIVQKPLQQGKEDLEDFLHFLE